MVSRSKCKLFAFCRCFQCKHNNTEYCTGCKNCEANEHYQIVDFCREFGKAEQGEVK